MKVSVIIPTYNRAASLQNCMNSLLRLKNNKNDFEIIVIDNGSTDATRQIINDFLLKHPDFTIRYFQENMPGLLSGRHKGASVAAGDILCFIDDDVQVSSGWMQTILEVMNNRKDIMFLTGPNLPFYESYPPQWLDYFWKKVKYGKICGWLSLSDFGSEVHEIHPNYVWGLNFIVRKSAFLSLGGFHPDNIPSQYQMFQGDGETGLTRKGAQAGMKALYHPGALVYHEVPASRLTYEYFDKRAYYQGICNSFAACKTEAGIYTSPTDEGANEHAWHALIRQLFLLKKKIESSGKRAVPPEIETLMNRFAAKTQEGFNFHQMQVRSNPKVKAWVMKPDYFDYQLPEL